jgi:hypothetical protein
MDNRNGQRFKVECNIDGRWFGDKFVFPDRESAQAYKQQREACSVNQHRIVVTGDPVNLPSEGDGEGEEGESSGEDEDSSLQIDWPVVLELQRQCPACLLCAGDRDLDKVYHQCECGDTVFGKVII